MNKIAVRILVSAILAFGVLSGNAYAQVREGQEEPIRMRRGKPALLDSESESYYQRGLRYIDEKKFDLAIEEFKKVLLRMPLCYEAYINIGASYLELRNVSQAVTYFNKALDIEPNDARTLINLGNAYRDLKEYQKAIECYQRAIEIDHEISDAAYDCLGSLYHEMKRYQEARQCYLEAIELYKKHGDNKNARILEEYLRNASVN